MASNNRNSAVTKITFTQKDYGLGKGVLRVNSGGTGRALIHLHSAAGPRISPAVEALADHHTVHAPVMPGYNGTALLSGVATMPDLADLVADFIRAECDGTCDVVGESFGGWIALWLAVRHPALVGQLVLEAPAGLRPADAPLPPTDPQQRLLALHAKPENAPVETRSEAMQIANRKVFAGYTGNAGFDDALAPQLGAIRARTLVLMGTLDKIIPASSGQLLKNHIAHSHLTYIWDAAHALEFDQPQRVSALTLDFLDRGESFLVRPAAGAA